MLQAEMVDADEEPNDETNEASCRPSLIKKSITGSQRR